MSRFPANKVSRLYEGGLVRHPSLKKTLWFRGASPTASRWGGGGFNGGSFLFLATHFSFLNRNLINIKGWNVCLLGRNYFFIFNHSLATLLRLHLFLQSHIICLSIIIYYIKKNLVIKINLKRLKYLINKKSRNSLNGKTNSL